MDKETIIRLAQLNLPRSIIGTFSYVMTLPITVKAYGDSVTVSGNIFVECSRLEYIQGGCS